MRKALPNIHIGFEEKKMIIVSISAASLLIISYMLINNFISPRLDRLSVSFGSLNSNRRILAIKEKNLVELQNNKFRLSAMNSGEQTGQIPNEAQAPRALILLSHEMNQRGIAETGFYIDPSESYSIDGLSGDESVVNHLITITGTGIYADVIDYLESLNKAEYFYQPVSYTITSRDMIRQDLVRFTLKLNLFILKGSGNHSVTSNADQLRETERNIKSPFYYSE